MPDISFCSWRMPKSFGGRAMARAPALLAVRAAITMPSLAGDPRRGIEEPSAKVPKSWGASGHGLHLPPNELEETPQAIATTLRRVRGFGKAMGLSKMADSR